MGDPFPAFSSSVFLWLFIATSLISNAKSEPNTRDVPDLRYVDTADLRRKKGEFNLVKAHKAASFVESEIELSISAVYVLILIYKNIFLDNMIQKPFTVIELIANGEFYCSDVRSLTSRNDCYNSWLEVIPIRGYTFSCQYSVEDYPQKTRQKIYREILKDRFVHSEKWIRKNVHACPRILELQREKNNSSCSINDKLAIRYLFGPFGREKDSWGMVDPMCVTYIRPYGDRWIEYHRTELLFENNNPKFARKVTLPYALYQERWSLKFSFYSVRHWDDSADWHLENHYFIGSAECNLGRLLNFGKIELSLKSEADNILHGRVFVHAEKLNNIYGEVFLKLAGTNLAGRNWPGQAELYIEISKHHFSSKEFVLVHRTEVIKDSTNPALWNSMTIPIKRLCNGDNLRALKFAVWHWRKTGGSAFIGEFHTTLRDVARSNQKIFSLKNWKKEDRVLDQIRIFILNFNLDVAPTFFDLIGFGLHIRCVVAINFTTLNGDPRLPGTLHHHDVEGGAPNIYEKAISSILTALEYLDYDNKFGLFGFGGRCRHDPGSLVFKVDPHSSECIGVEGVLGAYRRGVLEIEFAQSQNLALVIQQTITTARNFNLESNDEYFILLILTCGELDDIDETEKVVTEASTLPISIIIVGIGDFDFTTLKQLDDNILPKRKSDKKRRDIVKFVTFNTSSPENDKVAASYLVSEFMAEIPAQVVSYVQSKRFTPHEELLSRSIASSSSRFIPAGNLRSDDNPSD